GATSVREVAPALLARSRSRARGGGLRRAEQPQAPAHRALEELLDREQAVDLVGALEDAVDATVAVGRLDGVVGREPVTSVDLERLVYHRVEDLRAEHLYEAELDGVVRQGLHLERREIQR